MENLIFDHQRSIFFDDLSDRWDGLGPPPPDAKVKMFLAKLTIQPGDIVLDLGTGTGLLVPYLFEYDPEKVIAADLSKKMLAKVKTKHTRRFGKRLILLQSDVHALQLKDQSVNVAICNGAYPHFHDKRAALAELYRVLKPGGILAINLVLWFGRPLIITPNIALLP